MTTLLHTLKSGDHVVSMDDLYGGSNRYFRRVLNRAAIDVTFVDMANRPDEILDAMTPKTKVLGASDVTRRGLASVRVENCCSIA